MSIWEDNICDLTEEEWDFVEGARVIFDMGSPAKISVNFNISWSAISRDRTAL